VAGAQSASNGAASEAARTITNGAIFMVVITVVSITGAVFVMLYYVVPWIIRPLEIITKAMTDLARGDTSVDIPGRNRTDELGRMAQALGVFRDTAIEVQKSNLREIAEAQRRLSVAIESISEAFSLYDNEDRLAACNSKYRTLIFPNVADESLVGSTFETLIRRAADHGDIEDAHGRIEEWVQERLERHRNPSSAFLQRRRDGRWVIVSERKTEDGGTVAVYSDVTELKQREEELSLKTNALEQLSSQLAKNLSPQVYESIFTGRSKVTVASRRKKLTIFFSDLEGFTETTERLESEDLTQLLNHYLTEMSKIALQFGGTIDKYVGDAVLIFFGDPDTKGVKADAVACVKMAIAMRKRMRELESVWRASGIEEPPRCRTGINTGFCTVGNFGSEDRMDYTIIGSGVVDTTHRLERLSRGSASIQSRLVARPKVVESSECPQEKMTRAAGRVDQPHLAEAKFVDRRRERAVEDELLDKDRRLQERIALFRRLREVLVEIAEEARTQPFFSEFAQQGAGVGISRPPKGQEQARPIG
jgi:adenylate cyclase